jgi:tRNA 2-thiouridine synthesizing protein A
MAHHDQHSAAVLVDARGLNCPLPVLKLRKALRGGGAGRELVLLATDRTALRDVPVFCEAQGCAVSVCEEAEGVLRFHVKPSAGSCASSPRSPHHHGQPD